MLTTTLLTPLEELPSIITEHPVMGYSAKCLNDYLHWISTDQDVQKVVTRYRQNISIRFGREDYRERLEADVKDFHESFMNIWCCRNIESFSDTTIGDEELTECRYADFISSL